LIDTPRQRKSLQTIIETECSQAYIFHGLMMTKTRILLAEILINNWDKDPNKKKNIGELLEATRLLDAIRKDWVRGEASLEIMSLLEELEGKIQ
jgi:hypothetical protein